MGGGDASRAGFWVIQPHTTAPVERAREDGMDLVDAAGRHRPAALAALLAQVGVEGVQGGGVEPTELELAQGEPDGPVDVTALGGDGGGRDRPDALAPFQPAVQHLGHCPVRGGQVLAGADFGDGPGLGLLGLGSGGDADALLARRPVMGSRPA
jgi:hypothetical protein